MMIAMAMIVAACADDGGRTDEQHCADMMATITQRAGSCFQLTEDGSQSCPDAIGALCGGDGNEVNCPPESDGWIINCETDEFQVKTCRYIGACKPEIDNVVEFKSIQTYNETDGILIDTGDSCEFRECFDLCAYVNCD